MMQELESIDVKRWLAKAGEDELSLISDLKHKDGAPSTACFLAHQMGEKYLKALLVFETGDFDKIHDLKRLATILEKKVSNIFELENSLDFLNKYYITTRYPGDFPEGFTWDEAEKAYESAKKIKEFVFKKIEKSYYENSN